MKKIVFIFPFLLIVISLKAQFSLQTEISYLQHINIQQREDLIENNIPNAEGKLEEVLQFKSNYQTYDMALFLIELSRSYQLSQQDEIALYRLLMQRILFPVDSLNKWTKPLFEELAFRSNLSLLETSNLWQSSKSQILKMDFQEDLLYLIKLATQLNLPSQQNLILQSIELYRIENAEVPLWLDEWVLYTKVGLKEKHKKLLMDYSKNNNAKPDLSIIEDERLRQKLYRKSIKYYLRQDAFVYANELAKIYQDENQNVFESIDLCFKKFRIWLKW